MAEDYSFMKSGFNNLVQNNDDIQELQKNIATLVCYFAKNALKAAGLYVSHSSRNIVVGQDIKKAMKLEVFLYENHPNMVEELKEVKQKISEENMVETMVDTITENSEEYCDCDSDDVITDETEEYCNSECKCYLCETLNKIDERWISWKPKNPVEEILKKHIDNMSG